ncbi:class I SAM-dependent methyltransferase [Alkalibacillus silvisoli]|uniref:Class I SAM-dependent methyltransferase n=2 Tax=Alkalibacillus silvisoli TaxID=392823 RepID=A0ABP3JN76_9BACI
MAQVYDQLMQDAPYEKWVDFTISALNQFGNDRSLNVLDVGCGTGEISVRLAQSGLKVTAFDQSQDMIDLAAVKAKKADQNIHFFQSDARAFTVNDYYDVVVSYCDVLNYLTEENELIDVFTHIYNSLLDDGLFVFDVHSQHYLNFLAESEIFSEVRDEITYIWFCEQTERAFEVEHDLTFFVQDENLQYTRFDERHKQRAFTVDVYNDLLKSAGFTNILITEDFTFQPYTEESDRLFFICKKT